MPFNALPAGRKRKVVIEVRGPRETKDQKRFKSALQKLLKQHNASIRTTPKKKKPAKRRRAR